GDMALMMVSANLSPEQVCDPQVSIAFPESVVSFFRGELGQPYGGFPVELQKKVLQGAAPLTVRPGEALGELDLDAARAEANAAPWAWRELSDEEFASWLMYPKVFAEYMADRLEFGQVSVLPTTVYFYG